MRLRRHWRKRPDSYLKKQGELGRLETQTRQHLFQSFILEHEMMP
jgi:hypothetical protein